MHLMLLAGFACIGCSIGTPGTIGAQLVRLGSSLGCWWGFLCDQQQALTVGSYLGRQCHCCCERTCLRVTIPLHISPRASSWPATSVQSVLKQLAAASCWQQQRCQGAATACCCLMGAAACVQHHPTPDLRSLPLGRLICHLKLLPQAWS
jgi:hypothetical protein